MSPTEESIRQLDVQHNELLLQIDELEHKIDSVLQEWFPADFPTSNG